MKERVFTLRELLFVQFGRDEKEYPIVVTIDVEVGAEVRLNAEPLVAQVVLESRIDRIGDSDRFTDTVLRIGVGGDTAVCL